MRTPTRSRSDSQDSPAATPPDCPRFARGRLLAAAGIIATAGLVVYANSFRGVFLFDDTHAIVENANIRRLWPLWEAVGVPASRLTVNLSLAVNYAIGGYDVRGYHVFNLAVHIAAGLALFGVVRRTLSSPPLVARFGRASPAIALAAALIWTVHPLHTQSVTYIIQRAEAMMGLCYLLCLFCAIRGFASSRGRGWYAASLLACAAGMATKPVMATAPLAVLLYDRTFVSGSLTGALRLRWRLYGLLAATWVLLAGLLWISPAAETAGFGMERIAPAQYAATQCGVVLHYARLAFWPRPLVLDYNWPAVKGPADFAPQAVIIALLLAATLWGLWAKRPSAFAAAWFFLILAPTSSIMPIADVAFEHRMYLPLAGIVALVVAGAYRLIDWSSSAAAPFGATRGRLARGLGLSLAAAATVALGWTTAARNLDYHSAAGMWRNVIANRPDNARAHYGLAVALEDEGRPEQAMASYRKAIALNPRYADAHNNLAVLLAERGEFREAASHYGLAVEFRPEHAEGRFNLALALVKLGDFDEAAGQYEAGLALAPDNAVAHNNLGAVLQGLGMIDKAADHYAKAVRIAPDYPEARANLARAHFDLGRSKAQDNRPAEAIEHYRSAIAIRGDWPEAMNNLAWILATNEDAGLRDGAEAVELAREACRLTGYERPRMLITLAAAYAEAGQFQKAAGTLRAAMETSRRAGRDDLPPLIEAHIRLYESQRPCRDGSPSPQEPRRHDEHNPESHRAGGDEEDRQGAPGGQKRNGSGGP